MWRSNDPLLPSIALTWRSTREMVGADVGASMKLYRINKVTRPSGTVLKSKDVLAKSDQDAMQRAAESADCPVCDVLKDGRPIGTIQ